MNEENNLMAASELSRISEKHSTFYAFTSQKSESLPHSFFFDGFSSKVIFRVTQKALRDFLTYFRKYLALAGGSAPYSLLPMVT